MWREKIDGISGPRYLAIADAVTAAIDHGQLAEGDRLPPHRELAGELGVDVSTVTRAYAEIKRRGLVVGEVGRGTFVRKRVPDAPPTIWDSPTDQNFIDLSHNFPVTAPTNPAISEVVMELTKGFDIGRLMAYQVDLGIKEHRAAGAAWIESMGLSFAPEEVGITAGAQHGILLALASVSRPGDLVMTEELSFYGIKSAAELLGRSLVGVAMDAEGLVPEELDETCRRTGARVLYCTPTLHNPTTALMSENRRRRVAEVCARHGVIIIEDDVYGFLLDPRIRPLCSFAMERTIYVTSLSKCIGPGLRIGYIRAPREHLRAVGVALRSTTLMAAPLMAEVAARLIQSGAAHRMSENQRTEVEARQAVAAAVLPAAQSIRHPRAFHVWLQMKNGWTSEQYAAEVKRRGVRVAPSEFFAVGAARKPDAVRLCIAAAHDVAQLEQALGILAQTLDEVPAVEIPLV